MFIDTPVVIITLLKYFINLKPYDPITIHHPIRKDRKMKNKRPSRTILRNSGPYQKFRLYAILDENTQCWEWGGKVTKQGYGIMKINKKYVTMHRYSYQTYIGEIPKGMLICHRCDNPKCVNPFHLFLGTHADNAQDRVLKNRSNHPVGERCAKAVLKEVEVLEIAKSDLSITDLSEKYAVSKTTIRSIKHKKSWKHLIAS